MNNNNTDILQEAIASSILDIDSVQDMLMSSKIEKIKKMHPYAITAPTTDKGRWQTMYKDERGKRKNIKAPTEEELLRKLIPVYFPVTHIDKLTFKELYDEWLAYKSDVANSANTIKRHKQHYNKYLLNSAMNDKRIRAIDELLLEKECNRIIKEFNLTRKEWCNVKTIINGMYNYAIRKKYLEENLLNKIQISAKYRQVVRKTGKTETFNSEELQNINHFLDQMYEETMDSSYLAVKINFLLGLRVGELVALRWDDLVDENHLHIVREEVRDQTTNTITVVEHTKTNRDRFVVLIPKAISILNRIERQGEYIFMRNGERITSIRIASVLRKYARKNGIALKSSHKIRKTYASNLNASGVPLDSIRELLGHSNLSTTLGYIYNPLTEKETYDLIAKAL